jgi:hypothetical protein
MRQIHRYIKKYGLVAGTIIFKTLQKGASQARWKQFYRDRPND